MHKETAMTLPAGGVTERLTRLDAAAIFKRFFYLERGLTIACAGWVPETRRLESKAALSRAAWESAMTAHALRERVFELRYPDRSLRRGADAPLTTLFEAVLHAPSAAAATRLMADLLVPALTAAYEEYLQVSDEVADGPSYRFLRVAIAEKRAQQRALAEAAAVELALAGGEDEAARWIRQFGVLLDKLGGVRLEPPTHDVAVPRVVDPGRPFELAQDPGRDERYFACSFYWPDNFDSGYPYGDGLRLQLRSAVSHLNEVWAADTAAAILQGLGDALGWEFIFDAARWLYDESRHMTMGKQRLERWGFDPSEIPLGAYIYEACKNQDIIYRLGMLAYFETKNIGKKRERAVALHELGDTVSERDMDFDWADEAIHAGYGRRWTRRALEARGKDADDWAGVVRRCEELVARRVARATEQEKRTVRERAERLIAKGEELARAEGNRESA